MLCITPDGKAEVSSVQQGPERIEGSAVGSGGEVAEGLQRKEAYSTHTVGSADSKNI